jgi:hypothetical protein
LGFLSEVDSTSSFTNCAALSSALTDRLLPQKLTQSSGTLATTSLLSEAVCFMKHEYWSTSDGMDRSTAISLVRGEARAANFTGRIGVTSRSFSLASLIAHASVTEPIWTEVWELPTYTEHARRKTISTIDVVYALKRQGKTIYGFGG